MGVYIGATGLNEIDDLIASSIEDVSNILVDRIIIEDIHGLENWKQQKEMRRGCPPRWQQLRLAGPTRSFGSNE